MALARSNTSPSPLASAVQTRRHHCPNLTKALVSTTHPQVLDRLKDRTRAEEAGKTEAAQQTAANVLIGNTEYSWDQTMLGISYE